MLDNKTQNATVVATEAALYLNAQFYFNLFCIMDTKFMSTAQSLCLLQSLTIIIQKMSGHIKEKFSSKRD